MGFTTIGVDVTVCVIAAPDTVMTRVLTSVVCVHDVPVSEEVVDATAATVVLLDVFEVEVGLEEVEVVIVADEDYELKSAKLIQTVK